VSFLRIIPFNLLIINKIKTSKPKQRLSSSKPWKSRLISH